MGAPSYRAAPAPCAPGGQQHRLTAGLVAAAGASGAAAPSSSLQPTALQRQQQRRAPAPSEAGTYADWWQRPGSSSSSVLSYPMTAVSLLVSICLPLPRPLLKECDTRSCTHSPLQVTDRGGSVASTEFRMWMDKISQLESAVSDERGKRRQFEEELKKMQSSDAHFAVSRGGLVTGKTGDGGGAGVTSLVKGAGPQTRTGGR